MWAVICAQPRLAHRRRLSRTLTSTAKGAWNARWSSAWPPAGWVNAHEKLGDCWPDRGGQDISRMCAGELRLPSRPHRGLLARPRMLDELAIAPADWRFPRLLATWAGTDVLLIDDFLLRPLSPDQAAEHLRGRRGPLGVTVHRAQPASCPSPCGTTPIGEPTLADAVLDRLLENLQRVELQSGLHAQDQLRAARRQGAPGAPVVSCHVRSIDQREVSSGA